MSHDPSFLVRCQLWTALVALIPEEQLATANDLAAQLDCEYMGMVNDNAEIAREARKDATSLRAQLAHYELNALAAVPVGRAH